jgi:PAS domain S-box-containing protein
MADAKALPNLQALLRSPSSTQTLPSEAVLDALKMMLIGASLNDVLASVTRLIEAHSVGMLCSIFLLEEDGLHLRYGVAANLPQAYRAATDGVCIGPNVGSCGAAAYLRQPVFVSDILSHPNWANFRSVVLQSGLRSAWSTPIMSQDGKVLGTFCMYYREVRHPGTEDIQLIEHASRIAGIAIERERSRSALTLAFERIKKSEAELRTIVDAIPQLIVAIGGNGEFLYANQAVLEYTGLTREELGSEDFLEVFHPEGSERLRDQRAAALLRGVPFEYERRVRRKDGEYRWLLVQYNPLADERGEIIRWYATGTDIDDRKRAEDVLRASEQDLRIIFDTIPGLITVQNAAGEVELANRQLLEYFGKTLEEVKAWATSDAVHPDDLPDVIAAWRRSIETGHPYDDEQRIRRADGVYRWFHVRALPLRDAEGRIVRWYDLFTDIDERKKAEEELRRSKAYLTEAQRLSQTGSFGCRLSTGEMFWSEETFRIYGYDRSTQPAVERVLQRVHPEDKPLVQEHMDRASREGKACDVECRLLLPDDSVKHVRIVAHALRNESGITEFIGAVMDVTAQQQARAELEKAFDEIRRLKDRLHNENLALREEIDRSSMYEEIVGSSGALRSVISQVAKVAPTDSTVMICGETGTGKELIATAIHKRSKRSARAFIRVNCAAIPPSLIASELFGHEKGAFTGAIQRRAGRFESADGGTIFLDEIGELSPEVQMALLRVLQEREFERVGSSQPISIDVRVLAATNRDLEAAVAAGTFRQDLFYRLNVFPIRVPSLRERKDDIPLLVEYLVERYAKRAGKKISHMKKKTLDLFQAYDWPGNIRELQNVIERAVILCDGETFSVDETWLPRKSNRLSGRQVSSTGVLADDKKEFAERERKAIATALAECHGRVSGPHGAAAKLGIPHQTLASKIESLGIDKRQFKVHLSKQASA